MNREDKKKLFILLNKAEYSDHGYNMYHLINDIRSVFGLYSYEMFLNGIEEEKKERSRKILETKKLNRKIKFKSTMKSMKSNCRKLRNAIGNDLINKYKIDKGVVEAKLKEFHETYQMFLL